MDARNLTASDVLGQHLPDWFDSFDGADGDEADGRGNITLRTLLSLLRYTGQLGNLDNLIDDVLPDPFDRGGKERKRVRNHKPKESVSAGRRR